MNTKFLPLILIFVAISFCRAQQSAPGSSPQLPINPEFHKGVLYGKVLDLDGKPVANATVALQDNAGKVITWTSTNAQGDYALAANPVQALNLNSSRRRGLLESCIRGVGDLAMVPVKTVSSVIVNPGATIANGVVSVASGTPLPLAVQAAASLPGRTTAEDTARQARELAARTAVGQNGTAPNPVPTQGQACLLVGAPGFKDARIAAGTYWMEGPVKDKDLELGMQAWLETVRLSPTVNAKPSAVDQQALCIAEVVLDKTLIVAGGGIRITARLKAPPGVQQGIRIFARELKKNVVTELLLKDGPDKNLYEGTLYIDPKSPAGVTSISVGALRATPVEVKLDPKKSDPMLVFVQRLDDMRADKPYAYDPRIMASENRLDIKVNVLDVKKGSPPPGN